MQIEKSKVSALSVFQTIIAHPAFLLVAGFASCLAMMAIVGGSVPVFAKALGIAGTPWSNLLGSILVAGACVLGYCLFVRFIERKPLTDFAFKGAVPEFGYGLFIGAAAMAAVVGTIAAFGGYHIVGYQFSTAIMINMLGIAIISGVAEEVLLRGVAFRFLEQWLGSISALVLSALLFGVLHIGNPNASWLAAFAIALEAGILLGAIYMLTRRLWAAIGLHMAWNSMQGGVFGIKVSGTDVEGLIVSEPRGSDLLTGGLFGAEASIPAIIICTSIGIYFLWRAHQKGQFVPFSFARFTSGKAAV